MTDEPLPDSADPIDIAMDQTHADPGPARRLLIDQGRLVRTQIASERAGLVLKVLTGLAGLVAAGLLAALAWDAARTRTLVVRPFSVPPDMAARGMTGEVVATRMLDRLDAMQQRTVSTRAERTYANDWGEDVEVQIPQTGVSVSELQTLLRGWLGDETRITGEIVRLPDGRLSVATRAGGGGGEPLVGSEEELGPLVQQAAERVYRATQPERFAAYLAGQGKREEAIAVYRELANTGSRERRAWAYSLWGDLEREPRRALELQRRAAELDPRLPNAAEGAANALSALGHEEAELAENRRAVELLSGRRAGDYAEWAALFHLNQRRASVAAALGDLQGAVRLRELASHPGPDQPAVACQQCGGGSLMSAAFLAAANRDAAGARRLRDEAIDMMGPRLAPFIDAYLPIAIAYAEEDWRTAATLMEEPERLARIQALAGEQGSRTSVLPLRAELQGRVGRHREAAALIVQTPRDCYACLRARAKLFASMGRHAEADRLFAEAARAAPSLPVAHAEWAQARLERGDAAGALALAEEAARRGPRWAEPLKLQGDALARQGRWADAAARYRAALAFAPQWPTLRRALAVAERRAAT